MQWPCSSIIPTLPLLVSQSVLAFEAAHARVLAFEQIGQTDLLTTLYGPLNLPSAPFPQPTLGRVRAAFLLVRTEPAGPELVAFATHAEQVDAEDGKDQRGRDGDQGQRGERVREGKADDDGGDADAEHETGAFAQARGLVGVVGFGDADALVDVAEGYDGHADQGDAQAAAVEPAEGRGDFGLGQLGVPFP